jgi:DNA polymerase theta
MLRSTLSYHQLPFVHLADAARAALTALRSRKLLSLKPEGPSSPSYWELTPLGNAVVASTLPPDLGLLLHNRMSNLMSCLVLGGHLHLLFMLQPDPLFAIYDWNQWARLTKDFTAAHKCVDGGGQTPQHSK